MCDCSCNTISIVCMCCNRNTVLYDYSVCVRVLVHVRVRVVGGGWWVVGGRVVRCVGDLLLLLSCLCRSESVSFRHEIFESVTPVKERKTEKNLLCGFSYLS